MCSLFGLIDFKECLSTHTKNKILNTLARECQVRGTDATGIAYSFNDRLRIYKRPLPARKMKIHIPHGVNAVMGHTRMTTQGNAQFNQNNHPFLCSRSQRRSLERQRVTNGRKSADDERRDRQLRRRSAFREKQGPRLRQPESYGGSGRGFVCLYGD